MTNRSRVGTTPLHQQAQADVLKALLQGDDVDNVVAALAPFEVRGTFTPDIPVLLGRSS